LLDAPDRGISRYELGTSSLPPMFHHNNHAKMIKNREKS
jgi:hypothetical protein